MMFFEKILVPVLCVYHIINLEAVLRNLGLLPEISPTGAVLPRVSLKPVYMVTGGHVPVGTAQSDPSKPNSISTLGQRNPEPDGAREQESGGKSGQGARTDRQAMRSIL